MKAKITDVCKEIIAGGDVPKNCFSKERTQEYCIPIFANAENNNGLYGYTKKARIFDECITIAARGTIGYCSRRYEPFLPVVRLIVVVPNQSKITTDYLYYALKNLNLKGNGTSIPQLTIPNIKKYAFNLPDIKEQGNIVTKLKTIENIINFKEQQLVKLNDLIKSRFVEMFGEPNLVSMSDVTIGDVADVRVGIVIKPTRYYSPKPNNNKAFRSLNIGEGFIKDNNWVNFTDSAMKEASRSIVHTGDVIIVRTGNPGTSCVVSKKYDGYNVIDLIIATPNVLKILPEYLSSFTNFPHGKLQIANMQHGVAQVHFNVSMYKKLKIIVPTMDKQIQFLNTVQQTDKLKFAYC